MEMKQYVVKFSTTLMEPEKWSAVIIKASSHNEAKEELRARLRKHRELLGWFTYEILDVTEVSYA